MITDIKAAFELSEKAQGWLAKILQGKHDKDQLRAAKLLACAGVLLGALHAVRNLHKQYFSRSMTFKSSWTEKIRRAFTSEFQEFILIDKLNPLIEQKKGELGNYLSDVVDSDKEFIKSLIDAADAYIGDAGPTDLLFSDQEYESMLKFFSAVESANDNESVNYIVSTALSGIQALQKSAGLQTKADLDYGRLKANILTKFPGIVPPDWDSHLHLTNNSSH